jgi:hypothetical protein
LRSRPAGFAWYRSHDVASKGPRLIGGPFGNTSCNFYVSHHHYRHGEVRVTAVSWNLETNGLKRTSGG